MKLARNVQERTTRLLDSFVPPKYSNAEADVRRRARLVVALGLALAAFAPPYTTLYFVLGMPWTAYGCAVATLLVGTVPLTFRWTGSMRWAANQSFASLYLIVVWVCAFSGGVHSGALPWFGVIPALGLMMLGHRTGWTWAGVSAATVLAMGIADLQGVTLPKSELPSDWIPLERSMLLMGPILLVTALCSLFESAKDDMLTSVERAKQQAHHERVLADRARRDVQLVLDSVDQGLMMVDLAGGILPGRSVAIERWFGAPGEGARLWDYLGRCDRNLSTHLELAWSSLDDGALPMTIVLAQVPSRVGRDDRTLDLELVPVEVEGQDARVLVIVSDVTAVVAAELAEEGEREAIQLVQRMLDDPSGVVEFMREASTILDALVRTNASSDVQRRWLHTLKGNAGLLGVVSIARICHAIENRVQETDALTRADIDELQNAWTRFSERVAPFLESNRDTAVVVEREPYRAFVDRLRRGAAHEELLRSALTWACEPTRTRLRRIGSQARALAERLGRGPLEVVLDDAGVRLPSKRWSSFWSAFGHVVRNAVDHGLEPPDERRSSGKPGVGRLEVRTTITGGAFVIEARDDGRGIDWERVRRESHARGLPSEAHEDLVAAMFTDGLTTRDRVSDVSGRGVGLAAVMQETEALGGRVEVTSETGRGTTFRFVFPVSEAVPDTGELAA